MILGQICTRGCRFCGVTTGRPKGLPEADESQRIAQAVQELGLRYVVLTSVDRDDLPDGGAAHFASTIRAIHEQQPSVIVEVLTPDFGGDLSALRQMVEAGAAVVGHNLETTRSLTPHVRDRRCSYDLSLKVLAGYRELNPRLITKSSLLLGLGEEEKEIIEAFDDLRRVGVDWLTLGQYLRPTRHHLPVSRYLPPDEFEHLANRARDLGFEWVTAGPLVRSSYRAGEHDVIQLARRRGLVSSVSR
jgi:lipoic acid synthetase